MFSRASLFLLLIGCFALPAASQVQGPHHPGSYGTLTGAVHTLDGHAVSDARVEVREVTTANVTASGYTNLNGGFEFQNIAAGTYEVVATSGLDEVRESVTVQSDLASVSLRMPRMAAASSGGGATVSVTALKVPEKAQDENKKAREAMLKHDTASAWKHVTKALEITPQYAAGLTTRALLELDGAKEEAAIADLEKAVQADAGYGLSFLVLGASYNQMSRFDDAIRALDHGVALMPNYWQGYFELAKAYLGKNDLPQAAKQIKTCSERAPANYAPLHLVRANLDLAMKNYPEAMAELEAYLDREPNSPQSPAARKTLGEVKAFLAKK